MSKPHDNDKMRDFAERMYLAMNWGPLPKMYFKAANTHQWKGYCYARYLNGIPHDAYVIVSSASILHPKERDFWDSLCHEMIHARLWQLGYSIPKAFGHGKCFKNMAKDIANKFPELFTYKRIMK